MSPDSAPRDDASTALQHLVIPSASSARERLHQLETERALAGLEGLDDIEAYMVDLLDDLAVTRAVYIAAAVTEIASLRSALGAPLRG